jgi:phytoene dehydrogenase-like protein
MKVDVALRGRVDMSRHERWRGDGVDLRVPIGLVGSGAGMERAYARCAAGLMPGAEEILLLPAVLNAVDETQTPDGEDCLYLYCPTVPLRPDGGWPALATKAADVIVDCASTFYGTVTDLEIDRWTETPEQMAARTGATDGAVLHVDLARPGPLRPALGLSNFRLPVDGLFLGGAGAAPTGGVTGLPGRLVAREVTRTIRRTPGRSR